MEKSIEKRREKKILVAAKEKKQTRKIRRHLKTIDLQQLNVLFTSLLI